jgi:Leucine-rich repeat (LRR) protein
MHIALPLASEFWKALPMDLRRLSLRFLHLSDPPVGLFLLSQLEELDVRDNNLTSLPPRMADFEKLQILKASGNPLTAEQKKPRDSDASLFSIGSDRLLTFLRVRIDETPTALRSVQLVALGHFEVGKTAVLNALKKIVLPLGASDRTSSVTFRWHDHKPSGLEFMLREYYRGRQNSSQTRILSSYKMRIHCF